MASSAETGRKGGWYQGWNIVGAAVIAQALVNGLPINAFSLFLADWAKDLHTDLSRLSLAMAPLGLFSGVFSALVGILADKYPARWLFGIGLLGITAFEVGISFVTEPWQLQLLYAILLPTALTFASSVPGNAIISRWFVRRVGLAMGISAFGMGAAGAILPPIIAHFLPDYGWRAVWRVAGLISFLIMPLVMWTMRDRPSERDGTAYLSNDGTARVRPGHGAPGGAGSLRWRDIVKHRNFWLLVIGYLPMIGMYGGVAQNLAPIAASKGVSTETAGVLLSLVSIGQVSSTLITGLLSDRFGNRLPMAGLGFLVALGGVTVAFGNGIAPLAVGVTLIGLYSGVFPLLGAGIAREFGGDNVGKAFGLASLFIPLIGLCPYAVAKTQEVTGSYAPALLGLAAITTLAACIALMLRERGRDDVITGQAAVSPAE